MLGRFTVVRHQTCYAITRSQSTRETCLREVNTPLNPTFLIAKNGVCRGIPIFLIFAQNIDCRYMLEPPRPGWNTFSISISKSGKWNEMPKWSGVTVSQLIYLGSKIANIGSGDLWRINQETKIISKTSENAL